MHNSCAICLPRALLFWVTAPSLLLETIPPPQLPTSEVWRSPNTAPTPATGQHWTYYSIWTNRALPRDFHLRQRLDICGWELWSQGTQSHKGKRSQRLTLDEMRHNKGPLGDGAWDPLPCFFCRSIPQINEALFCPTSLKGIAVNCISEAS